ncbi:MAG TPA: aldo/keto reductase [Candidatus Saccharimonadales bacterium]|nr:aldo/keto reductase [Candidatus Saccharimonadales bacterium]
MTDSVTSVSGKLKLSDDAKIPYFGLGVWQIPMGEATENAVTWALEAGYRHIDTATIYRNERSVGKAILNSKIPREKVWITTKLWPTGIANASRELDESLAKLGLDYVDLYLIHFPIPGLEKKVWKIMEKLHDSGKCKSIGVSNFSPNQLSKVLLIANTLPAVNQIKLSPFNYDREVHDFHEKAGIAIEAYSPLTVGKMLGDSRLQKLAIQYKKTSPQILIRWALQKGFIVIPRSQNREHIIENSEVFDFNLTDAHMNYLDSLSN